MVVEQQRVKRGCLHRPRRADAGLGVSTQRYVNAELSINVLMQSAWYVKSRRNELPGVSSLNL